MTGFAGLIWLLNERRWPAPWWLGTSLLALFLFPPLWVHVLIGQFSMMFVLLMTLCVFFPSARRWMPLLLAIGLTKPQLSILVYPGLFIYTWRHEGWKAAVKLALLTAACMAALTSVLFLFYPGWVADFLSITLINLQTRWDLPTLFVQLPVLLGPAGRLVWLVVFMISFGSSAWLWFNRDAKEALVFSLALTPMVTTYASSWDFLLMLPAFYWLLFRLKAGAARGVLLAGMACAIVLQIAPRLSGNIPDARQWWVPPVIWAVYLLSLFVENIGRQSLAKWKSPHRSYTS
jgi:hypothetical protein